jgi:hypothetical protein
LIVAPDSSPRGAARHRLLIALKADAFGAKLPVFVPERQVPSRMQGHEVEHLASKLVVVNACVADGAHDDDGENHDQRS